VSAPAGIECQVWSNITEDYAVCVNTNEETSPYFSHTSGDKNLHVRAHVFDVDGGIYPPYECDDGVDNDRDGDVDLIDSDCTSGQDDEEGTLYAKDVELNTSQVYIAKIDTGVQFNDLTMDQFSLEKVGPGSVSVRYAIYSDGEAGYVNPDSDYDSHFDINRDGAPDTKIYDNAVILTQGVNEIPLPNLNFEHTRDYFVVVKALQEGIVLRGRDVRSGALSLEGNAGFMDLTEQAPVLYKGQTTQGIIDFGSVSDSYCVKRDIDSSYQIESLSGGQLDETFGEYGVHIYKFADYIGPEILDGLDNDCNGLVDDVPFFCGDNICNGGETPLSCSQDCGECASDLECGDSYYCTTDSCSIDGNGNGLCVSDSLSCDCALADVNGGGVDVNDLISLGNYYAIGDLAGDVNSDGNVDIFDLIFVAGRIGVC
ncbi:MAG: hypothetical protein KC506_02880, partial [Nanoarchaeota archaeon]|nr:hypothetical protein [Nanoarchaeota archaeon]